MTMAYAGESIFLCGDYDDDVFQSIQEAKSSDKTVLYLQRLTVTASMASSIIELVAEKHTTNNRGWTKIVVCECPVNFQLHRILTTAVQHFENIVLADVCLTDDSAIRFLSAGLEEEVSPIRLEFREMSLDAHQTSALARGIIRSTKLQTLRFGTIHFKDMDAISYLSRGLRDNRSLRNLQMIRCELLDDQLALLVDSIIGHPALKSLDFCGNYTRERTLRSLSNYLSFPSCGLVALKIGDQFYKKSTVTSAGDASQGFPIEELLPGLQANDSLAYLDLSRNKLSDISAILSILWYCPHIQSLDLLGNRIANLQALAGRRLIQQKRPSRLRRLELGHNCLWEQRHHQAGKEEIARWLVQLLEGHPELECFARVASQSLWAIPPTISGGRCSYRTMKPQNLHNKPILNSPLLFWKDTSYSRRIQHYLDLNKTGRILVANNEVPIGLWPLILHRANRLLTGDKTRQANTIFHLLRGPLNMKL